MSEKVNGARVKTYVGEPTLNGMTYVSVFVNGWELASVVHVAHITQETLDRSVHQIECLVKEAYERGHREGVADAQSAVRRAIGC